MPKKAGIDPDATGTAIDRMRAAPALDGPDVVEWAAPPEPAADIRDAFTALGFALVIDAQPRGIRFEAWRTPRALAIGAIIGIPALLMLLLYALRAIDVLVVLVVLAIAVLVPFFVLPEYRVTGQVASGKMRLRVSARGLLARAATLEASLRERLEKS